MPRWYIIKCENNGTVWVNLEKTLIQGSLRPFLGETSPIFAYYWSKSDL